MDFHSLFDDPEIRRHCYLRASALKKLSEDSKVLDALIAHLGVPGKTATALKALPPGEKLQLIERQIEHLRATKTSQWFEVPAPEVFAASLWLAKKLPGRNTVFSSVGREAALCDAVSKWLVGKGLAAHAEVPMGAKRVDVLGFKDNWWETVLVGVELKNDLKELERGFAQMNIYADYCHKVYLACTPALAAEYLARHANGVRVPRWDGSVLKSALAKVGLGLLLVEGDHVHECHEAKLLSPAADKIKQVKDALAQPRTAAR